MFLDKRKDKRENFCVINAINDSDHSFIFFRQRNTTEFKLKNFIKTLWRVPTAKSRAYFSPKIETFGECLGGFQLQGIVRVLAKVPRQTFLNFRQTSRFSRQSD